MNKINKNKIKFYKIDVSREILRLEKLIKKINPDTIIHFAEQRSAPYSMINLKTRNYTLSNNILTNNNILYLIAKLKKNIHLIHLVQWEFMVMILVNFCYQKVIIKKTFIKNIINTKILHPANPIFIT